MKDRVVLITKDAMCKEYLPVYGNKVNLTPNIDELANKGTIYNRFYTVAPSTAMSAIGMFTQTYPYLTDTKKYVALERNKNTVYDKLNELGYECHIIWDECDVKLTKVFSECYGENTIFHIMHVDQVVGSHNLHSEPVLCDDKRSEESMKEIKKLIDDATENISTKLFLWIHIPQVIIGRACYGTDIDLFDEIVGYLRTKFNDECIYISADHGNMNGYKNKIAYGFDVYEPCACIPLIGPRINNCKSCDIPISNVHILDIMNGSLSKDKFVIVDTAYYAQPHRKIAIIKDKWKYIYNKETKEEELYDLEFDPNENCNIVSNIKYDVDRKVNTLLNQVYFYPFWSEANFALDELKAEFTRIWREETLWLRFKYSIKDKMKYFKRKLDQKRK